MVREEKPDKSYLGRRFEFKYMVDPIKALQVEEYIRKMGLEPDNFSRNGAYKVHSIYFETPFLDDYRDKDGSWLARKKLRVRWYDNHNEIPQHAWLEIKNKKNQTISKERTYIPGDYFKQLIRDGNILRLRTKPDILDKDQATVDRFCYLYLKGHYHPYVLVTYDRTAYLGNYLKPIRITFDKNVQAAWAKDLFQNKNFSLCPVSPGVVTIEVKFNGQLPQWFTIMLTKFDLRRDAFSKYVNSVNAVHNSYNIPISR